MRSASMTAEPDPPPAGGAWRRIADDLMHRIRSGDLPVGSAIPVTDALAEHYGCSRSPVQRAVRALREIQILAGYAGDRVYVRRCPAPGERIPDDTALAVRVAALEAWVTRHERDHG
jgi:DNA-binding FadR family transcriptional regulator